MLTVPCPRRGSIGLEECIDCPHLTRLDIDPDTNEVVLACLSESPLLRRRTLRRVVDGQDPASLECTPVSALLPERRVVLGSKLGIREVATLFVSRDLDYAPVVDDLARPIGVLSKSDLLRWSWRDAPGPRHTLPEIMGPPGAPLLQTASIARAAATLVESGLDYVTVVSPSGAAAGVLSPRDLLGWFVRARSARAEERK
jgi:CBS domain-containing protein